MPGLFFQACMGAPLHAALLGLGNGVLSAGVRNVLLGTAVANVESFPDPAAQLRKELQDCEQRYNKTLDELVVQDDVWRSMKKSEGKARARAAWTQLKKLENDLARLVREKTRQIKSVESGIGEGNGRNVAVRLDIDETWLLNHLQEKYTLDGRQILYRALHHQDVLDATLGVAALSPEDRPKLMEEVLGEILDREAALGRAAV